MWRSLQWRAKEAKYDSASEDESIPDATGALVGSKGPHPWGGPSEGDDRDYDFLKRGEECRELYPGKVEFREALQRKLQHHAVRNPAEQAAWLGDGPEDALHKLHSPSDPSRRELVGVSFVAAY